MCFIRTMLAFALGGVISLLILVYSQQNQLAMLMEQVDTLEEKSIGLAEEVEEMYNAQYYIILSQKKMIEVMIELKKGRPAMFIPYHGGEL